MYPISFAQVELTTRELFDTIYAKIPYPLSSYTYRIVQCNKIPQETKLLLIMNTSDHMELTNAFACC